MTTADTAGGCTLSVMHIMFHALLITFGAVAVLDAGATVLMSLPGEPIDKN